MAMPPHLRSPVVFALPDTEPDARLNVFGNVEFHVHSIILKLYSAFFRKFLDSPDKENTAISVPTPGQFRYEWVTEIDEDGKGWHLIAAPRHTEHQLDTKKFCNGSTAKIKEQQCMFRALLCSMYNQPYNIDPMGLIELTKLADYYCALPVLSRSLDGAFFRSRYFARLVATYQNSDLLAELLQAAVKLRHPGFYRDCLTLAIGPWNAPHFKTFEDGNIKRAAQVVYNQVVAKVAKVRQDVIDHSNRYGDLIHAARCTRIENNIPRNVAEFAAIIGVDPGNVPSISPTVHGALCLPSLFRKMKSEFASNYRIPGIFLPVLEGELVMDKSGQPGEGPFKDYFLCVGIKDEDLPWDLTEVDW